MRKAAMVLTAVLVAGSAMADGGGIYTSGGRTDDGSGAVGSGCCPAGTQSSGGYFGSGLNASSQDGGTIGSGVGRDGGGTIGSGTRTQDTGYFGSGHSAAAKQRASHREFRLFGFLIAIFD